MEEFLCLQLMVIQIYKLMILFQTIHKTFKQMLRILEKLVTLLIMDKLCTCMDFFRSLLVAMNTAGVKSIMDSQLIGQ